MNTFLVLQTIEEISPEYVKNPLLLQRYPI
jgi:hypothetical protein